METKLKGEEEIDSEGESDANEETERAEKQSCTQANAFVFPGASHWVGEGSHHFLFAQDSALSSGLNSQMPLISQQFTMITL